MGLSLLCICDRTLPGKMFLPCFTNEISLISLLLIFPEVTLVQNFLAVGQKFQRWNTCLSGAEQNRDIRILFTQRNMDTALQTFQKAAAHVLAGINATNYFMGVSNVLGDLLPPPQLPGHSTQRRVGR